MASGSTYVQCSPRITASVTMSNETLMMTFLRISSSLRPAPTFLLRSSLRFALNAIAKSNKPNHDNVTSKSKSFQPWLKSRTCACDKSHAKPPVLTSYLLSSVILEPWHWHRICTQSFASPWFTALNRLTTRAEDYAQFKRARVTLMMQRVTVESCSPTPLPKLRTPGPDPDYCLHCKQGRHLDSLEGYHLNKLSPEYNLYVCMRRARIRSIFPVPPLLSPPSLPSITCFVS